MLELLTRPTWLFDLDGTLVDSSAGVVRAFHAAQAAFDESPAEAERIRNSIGYPLTATVARLSRVPYERFYPVFLEEAMSSMHHLSALLPGARELLECLAGDGKLLALVTSKQSDNARRILSHLGVEHHFAAVVGSESVSRPKPDPEPVRFALTQLRATPAEALMVGDTQNDIRAAHAAHVPTIAVTGGVDSAPRLAAAELVVAGPGGLLELLRGGAS